MPATLQVNVSRMKDLLQQCTRSERLELVRYLDRMTLGQRLKSFRRSMKRRAPGLAEITREAELVRSARNA